MNKLIKNPGIVISAIIVGMVALNLLFSHSVLASFFSELPDNYHVYEDTTTDRILYWNGRLNGWDIISAPNIPRVYFNGGGCDTADSDLRFDGSKIYWNCSSLVVRASTMSWWFDEANLAYRIADFDSRETATVSGGRITRAGSLSDVTITNGGKDARSDSYGCSGGNPNTTDACSILVLFSYAYRGEGFRLVVNDRTYLPSEHEYYYDAPSLKDFRTLTFNPNGGSVTDVTSGRALWYHKVGENAKREFEWGVTAQNWPTPTRSGYSFDGWYTAAIGGTLAPATRVMNTNETYYAHWSEVIDDSDPATITPSATRTDYEKGSNPGTTTIPVTFSIDISGTSPCTAQTVTWTASGPDDEPGSNLGTHTFTNSINSSCQFEDDTNPDTTISPDRRRVSYRYDKDKSDFNPINVLGPTQYTISITSPTGITPAQGNINVFEVPYARFYGNDVYAYGCGNPGTEGQIIFNTNDIAGVNAAGSASQYASINRQALNIIHTAALRAGGTPNALNTLKATWPSGSSLCSENNRIFVQKLRSLLPNNPTDIGGADPFLFRGNSLDPGYYTSDNHLNLGGNGQIDQKVTFKAPTITITQDINVNPSYALNHGGVFKDDIERNPAGAIIYKGAPFVLIIAEGDINIAPGVHNIDAVLISLGGNINTCSGVNRDQLDEQCRSKLTINGAISAKNILFNRSIGTRYFDTYGEEAAEDEGLGSAAEVVNYPGYMNFSSPFLRDTSPSGFQSIFNAPPLL